MARRACMLYLLAAATADWLYEGFSDRGGLELTGHTLGTRGEAKPHAMLQCRFGKRQNIIE